MSYTIKVLTVCQMSDSIDLMTDTYTARVIRWRLETFMTENSVTQYALQKESGVALNTIKDMYRGKTKRPDLEVLDRVLVALGVLTRRSVGLSDVLEYSQDEA